MQRDRILKVLPMKVRRLIEEEQLQFDYLQEIRLRTGKPLLMVYRGDELMAGPGRGRPYIVTKEDIREMMGYISNYSLYAY